MDTRRAFLKKAALLAGTAAYWETLPEPIRKALAIDPAPGSTYLDAAHVVILMQENRSFDHAFGSLQGVRGFDDPRAIRLSDGRPVWCQSDAKGNTYAPFRLDMQGSRSTWMSSLPHSWTNQVDAFNNGQHDGWLPAKRSGSEAYADMPLTLGYYNREDIPFYYALADAFTLCDQNFCSSLTGTTPNRLHLWTGTIREQSDPRSRANVWNEDVDYDHLAHWKTFPERLEELGVSWKIYQNELSLPVGFQGEEESWLSNFGDNPLEWFGQYQARFSPAHYAWLKKQPELLEKEIRELQRKRAALKAGDPESPTLEKAIREKEQALAKTRADLLEWSPERYTQLSPREKALHEKAFVTNRKDPHYHELTELRYREGLEERSVQVPKGDVLQQFRADVEAGLLPTVSWIVAPEHFSDHPSSAWYGAWYVSEVMHILTQDPKVWEKTIFLLAYDENDGYFDHAVPFVPPHPDQPHTGLVSRVIDPRLEFVDIAQERSREEAARGGPIGLGFRVPLLIASPWSRGGRVCSEVFDHTSVLQFLENFLRHKTGKPVEESNISSWRRHICGDLSSAFRPYKGERYPLPASLHRDELIQTIHKAKFQPVPTGYRALSETDIQRIERKKAGARQEKGMRPSCALPYELYADGQLSADKKRFEITMGAHNTRFGQRAAGAPFQVYVPAAFAVPSQPDPEKNTSRNYAIAAGDALQDAWALADFADPNAYHFRLYGPNGFYREFTGTAADPELEIHCAYQGKEGQRLTGNLELQVCNTGQRAYPLAIVDNAYGHPGRKKVLRAGKSMRFSFSLKESRRWYDFSLKVEGFPAFEKRYAGRVETGEEGWTDPLIGA